MGPGVSESEGSTDHGPQAWKMMMVEGYDGWDGVNRGVDNKLVVYPSSESVKRMGDDRGGKLRDGWMLRRRRRG